MVYSLHSCSSERLETGGGALRFQAGSSGVGRSVGWSVDDRLSALSPCTVSLLISAPSASNLAQKVAASVEMRGRSKIADPQAHSLTSCLFTYSHHLQLCQGCRGGRRRALQEVGCQDQGCQSLSPRTSPLESLHRAHIADQPPNTPVPMQRRRLDGPHHQDVRPN